MDSTQLPRLPASKGYYQLGRAALAIDKVLENPNFTALRAIFGICFYLQVSDQATAIAECNIIQGILVKMVQSVRTDISTGILSLSFLTRWAFVSGVLYWNVCLTNVDRDSGRWNLPEEETQRRRRMFWEIYLFDMWQSFGVGRPPAISSLHFDTKIPLYPEEQYSPIGCKL